MSSNTVPITAHQFAEAIKDLPLANLHLKASEIRNSIAHLVSSNQQLRSFADGGDSDCKEAIDENGVVIQRMEERIRLLRREVESRGFKWGVDELMERGTDVNVDRLMGNERDTTTPRTTGAPGAEQETISTGGRLGDEELARRIRDQLGEDQDTDENGVHL